MHIWNETSHAPPPHIHTHTHRCSRCYNHSKVDETSKLTTTPGEEGVLMLRTAWGGRTQPKTFPVFSSSLPSPEAWNLRLQEFSSFPASPQSQQYRLYAVKINEREKSFWHPCPRLEPNIWGPYLCEAFIPCAMKEISLSSTHTMEENVLNHSCNSGTTLSEAPGFPTSWSLIEPGAAAITPVEKGFIIGRLDGPFCQGRPFTISAITASSTRPSGHIFAF